MELTTYADVDAFMAVAGDFLEAREAEHNLIFGISSYVRDQPTFFGERLPYFAAVLAGERVVAAALRTPPHNLVLSEIDDPAAIDLLVADRLDDDLPGVLGPVEHARAFAERWAAAAGRSSRKLDLGADLSPANRDCATGGPGSASYRDARRSRPRRELDARVLQGGHGRGRSQ